MAERLAVFGLGLMGGTFADHLLKSGLEIVGYDPEPDRQHDHQQRGGIVATTVGQAITSLRAGDSSTKIILMSLPNSSVTLALCAEIASAGTEADGLLIIDATTGKPDDAIEAAAMLAEVGASFVDATVSGNAVMAAAKDLIFMAGGHEDDVARCAEVLAVLGREVYPMGPVGSGARAKLVVNHVLSINRAAIAEGLTVAEKAGIDLSSMLTVLQDSAASSKALEIWGQRMVDGDHYPPNARITQSLKDSHLINDHAESVGASHQLVQAVLAVFTEAQENGLNDADNSSVMEVMRRRSGIGRIDR